MGGKETVKKLREIDPKVKIIASSGYAESSVAQYKEDGFDTRLNKTYSRDEMNEVIFQVFSQNEKNNK
jgi:CheY-like chemotaxis protein